ncbi:MAG: hypothetical protein U9O18_10915, partial [Chloroflexota bacterium]|nr:hypothetical protein [Chloroflexota bacterium]
MTAPRPSWRVALGTSLALALTVAIPAVAEEEEGPIGHDPSNVIPLLGSEPMDLLGPAGPMLSGQAWLRAAGADPGQGAIPTSDLQLGPDLGTTGSGSSRTQAAGAGAPVPFREPGPAFSRNILVTRDFGQAPYQTEPHIEANPNDPE